MSVGGRKIHSTISAAAAAAELGGCSRVECANYAHRPHSRRRRVAFKDPLNFALELQRQESWLVGWPGRKLFTFYVLPTMTLALLLLLLRRLH